MAEATTPTNPAAEAAALKEAARLFDLARMRKVGGVHFTMVMGALTLWGAAEAWAELSGWGVAQLAAVANALIAGTVIPSTIHEWGHFAGARASGAVSPVHDEPKGHFAMFEFAMDQNDGRQFAWMSWGGILAPWAVVLLVVLFVPLATTGALVFLATLVARAVSVSVFEIPVVQRAEECGDPGAALGEEVRGGGLDRGRRVGLGAGLASFVVLWLLV